jgi:isopentenyldiphosphate isomerase
MPAATMLDWVDEQDQWVGTIARADLFKGHANFRVAHVFIFNWKAELLLQRLAASRTRHPGRWGSSVAAYVAAGEDYAQAAARRLREELGLSSLSLEEVGKTEMSDDGCRKFITLFAIHSDGPFAIDRTHIAEVEFASIDRIQMMAAGDPATFTPTFLYLLDFYLKRRAS